MLSVVNLIDLYPTLAELCGLDIPESVDGRSFAALLADGDADWSEPTLTTMGFKNHSLRDSRYRYSLYADGTEELYDHQTDPMEWQNLASDPELQAVKDRLSQYLPTHDEPVAGNYEMDKKRLRRALATIRRMGPEFRDQADQAAIDPELLRSVYESTK